MTHSIIIHISSGYISLSLFDNLDVAHHINPDQALYYWIANHLVTLIYSGLVRCTPSYIVPGTNHYNVIARVFP
jgi:hypothetical protein